MWRRNAFVLLVLLLFCALLWRSQVFVGNGFKIYVLSYIPLGTPDLAVLKAAPEKLDPFMLRDALYQNSSIAGLRAGPTLIFNHSGTSLRVFEEAGGFLYDTLASLDYWEQWQGGTLQAGELMQHYVYLTGGFPETIEFERRTVHKQGLFVTGYTFIYRQWFRGYPGLGFGGLRVTLGNGNLVHMLRSLHHVEGEVGVAKRVISAREALRVAAQNIGVCTECARMFFVHSVRLGYFTLWPEVRQEKLEPVWEIRFSGHTLYINAHTRELMFGDGGRYAAR